MEQYIPKTAVVAEIERIKSILGNPFCLNETAKASWVARKDICEDILSFLDTFEVKEVNFEKELNDYGYHYDYVSLADRKELVDFAKYFFELGLKTQKGE